MKVFETLERVALCDTDASGIVHFMFVLRFFEVGEREAFRSLGIKVGDPAHSGIHLPRVHVEISYHCPLFADDLITIRTNCERIGRTSMVWHHQIFREDTVCASGTMTVVLVDPQTTQPIEIPQHWREFFDGLPLPKMEQKTRQQRNGHDGLCHGDSY